MSKDFEWTDRLGHTHQATTITDSVDVTEEILELAYDVSNDWFGDTDKPVDWEYFWERLDGSEILSTGREVDMGNELETSAMRKIKKCVRRQRAEV